MSINKRRDFIKKTACSLASVPFMGTFGAFAENNKESEALAINIFSKHLQFLDYKSAAEATAEMGFDGLDLTVRPNGHVLPERVKTDLPKAIADIKSGGSTCQMITTTIESVNNPLDVDVIRTASEQGVKYYRTNWFKYLENEPLEASINIYKNQVKELSQLNAEHHIIGCYQNHAGLKIGGSFWEIKALLQSANPDYFGVQYDIRHAIAEGGLSWENGLKLLRHNIKTIVLKDFKWGKVNGTWKPINVPIGEGMVDFDKYFKLLKAYNLKPPVSLHLEYDLGGAEKGNSKISVGRKVVFNAMKKDLQAVRQLWQKA